MSDNSHDGVKEEVEKGSWHQLHAQQGVGLRGPSDGDTGKLTAAGNGALDSSGNGWASQGCQGLPGEAETKEESVPLLGRS